MKAKENKTRHVPTDQPYVQNINLVTGDKFNYDRPLITERQIKQLCIDLSKSYLQKFTYILKDGQKIQKWSIFQNLPLYIKSNKDAHMILEEINKNYNILGQFLAIIGQGIANDLQKHSSQLTKQSILIIFQLMFRTITQNPIQVEDWSKVLQKIAHHPYINIEKCIDFINGSFSMNAPPDKRRVAFCMIRHLMKYSREISKIAVSKVLFFNKDQNAKTRLQICYVMRNILSQNQREDQVWKCINQYYHDKDVQVREIAAETMCGIYYQPNFQTLVHLLTEDRGQMDIHKYFGSFVVTYQDLIQAEQRPKIQIFSFINRTIKSKKIQNISMLFNSLTYQVFQILGQGQLYEEINFGVLPLKSKQVYQSTLSLCFRITNLQFKQSLKNLLLRTLKQNQYQYTGDCTYLGQILDLTQQDQILMYLAMCNKLLEISKWYQIIQMLEVFKKLNLFQSLYDKACLFILRLWLGCPAFMIDKVIEQVIYLVLMNKRSFQFLITIRQKILNSKCWNHRKNYIIFYSAFKEQTSFNCHKFVPTLNYTNIICDKSVGVKLTFIQHAPIIYKYTDPTLSTQKAQIRESLAKLQQEKDLYLKKYSQQAKIQISKIDKNPTWLSQIYQRNKQLIQKQTQLTQVAPQPKKTIKTQNQISKSTAKTKKRPTNEHRRTINVGKVQIQKDISIDAISIGSQKNTIIPKKTNLFRCHSVKIKAPTAKKT